MGRSNPLTWRRRAISFLVERFGMRGLLEERWRRDVERSVTEGRAGLEGAASLARRHDIRTSVASAVAEAPLVLDPVPHLVAEPLVPADVYDLLVRNLPEPSAFGPEHSTSPSVGLGGLDFVSPLTRMVWEWVDHDIAQTIAETAVPRLRPYLHQRYVALFGADKANAVAASPHSARAGRLTLHRQGHLDRPHVPPKDSAITVVLGVEPPGSGARWRLALHAIDGRFAPVRTGVSYPEDHGCTVRPIGHLPLRANAAIILANTGHAQSVDQRPATETNGALGYTFTCHLGPERSVLVDVAASLPAAAQQGWLGLLTEPLQ